MQRPTAYAATVSQPAAPDRRSPDYIRWLQRSLNRIMGTRLTVDGAIGRQTRDAVRAFQGRRGLPADGVAGPATERALIAAGAEPPPAASAPRPSVPGLAPATPAAPAALVRREEQPPAATLYVSLPLGSEAPARPLTGIFIPAGYRPVPQVDLVLYLHGHKTVPPARPDLSIDGYWDSRRHPLWALREATNESRRQVVLVAPTLGPRSQAGSLTRPGGFDAYLGRVLAALHLHGPHRAAGQPPALGSLVLACHSGGGWPMRQLARGTDRAAQLVRECWAFDCLYNRGDPEAWAGWARANPAGRRLYVYYRGSTKPNSERLRDLRLPNVAVEWAAREHNSIPGHYWRQRLQAAPFLRET